MSILSRLFGNDDMETAEAYLRGDDDPNHISALIRHYPAGETSDAIERETGVRLTDHETAKLVQKLRDEYGCGPIAEYNLPGYVDPTDYPEDQQDQMDYNATREERDADIESERGGGFFGWLFGK